MTVNITGLMSLNNDNLAGEKYAGFNHSHCTEVLAER